MLKIAICDDMKKDRERVHKMVLDYCEQRKVQAEIKVYDHPDHLLVECEQYRPHISPER